MKQSNNKKSRDVTAFLYERLSRDDNLEGESYSIGNQKKLLAKVAKEKGYTNLVHFLDDGISGVTMDRPGFVEMICQLEQGKAAAVFVKDLSRLGRNYIEVGRLTEEFFPNHDIRLVAVSDNIDTAEGENELAPIRNLFNEWYARDISKKRRISNKIKGNAGEPMGQPPYGYIKDPNDPKHWIVDDEAAQVVRRVYSMTLEGFGTEQIAAQLEKDGVLTPRAYWLTKGIKRPGKGKQQPPTKWNSSTITKILSLQEYCGDILNFKTYSKSYKNKKRIDNDRENWVVFQDVHEAIIERAVYEQVQQKRGKIRKRRTNNGEHNMFSGLLVCADCGSNLHFHLQVIQLGHVLQLELLQFVAAHLFLVQFLLVVGLGALQVQLQDGRAYVHTVSAFLIYFQDAGTDGRIDDLLESRDHLSRSAHADLDRAPAHL